MSQPANMTTSGTVRGDSAGSSWSMARVITASSAGTAFEWYDFFIFGSLTPVIAKVFLAGLDPTSALIAALALFAVGFAFVRLLKDTAPTDRARNGHDEGGYDTQNMYSGGYLRGQYGDERERSQSHRGSTQGFERNREDV